MIDLSTLEPTVAFPHLPENTKPISEVPEIKIDQVVIGSCTNGRIEDLRVAAKILEGKKCAKGLRVIVIPATQAIYLQAMEEGIYRGGSSCIDSDLWSVSWWSYGYSCSR